jgi:hypothetical protein
LASIPHAHCHAPRVERVAVRWLSRWWLIGGTTAKLLDWAPRLHEGAILHPTSDGFKTFVQHVRRYAGFNRDVVGRSALRQSATTTMSKKIEHRSGTLPSPQYRRKKTQELRVDEPCRWRCRHLHGQYQIPGSWPWTVMTSCSVAQVSGAALCNVLVRHQVCGSVFVYEETQLGRLVEK